MDPLMRYSIITTILLFVYACNSTPSPSVKEQPQANIDTLKPSPKIDTAEENKILGNINFGMPRRLAEIAVDKFEKESAKHLGAFYFGYAAPLYYHDSLYSINLSSYSEDATKFDSYIHSDVVQLYELFSKKYGIPAIDNGFPELNQLSNNRGWISYQWNYGFKQIQIQVQEREFDFSVALVITDTIAENRLYQEDEDLRKQEQSKDQDKI